MGKNEILDNEVKIKRALGVLLQETFPMKTFTNINGYRNCYVIKFNNIVEISIFTKFLINTNITFDGLNRTAFILKMVDIYVSRKGFTMECSFHRWCPLLLNQAREKNSIPFSVFYEAISKNEILAKELNPLMEVAFNFKETFGNNNGNQLSYYLKCK